MFRIVRRHRPPRRAALLGALVALAAALLAGAAIFLCSGVSPLEAYSVMASGAFGSKLGLSEVVVKAIPLTLTGLAVAVAATMLLWNIGAEGQFVFGAVGAAWAALYLSPHLPPALALPSVVLCGGLAGMLWALIPALLRAYWEISEILTTLLLNYVAVIFMEHLYFGPWRNPMGFGFPGTPDFPDAVLLPRLHGTRIHLGLALAVVLAPLLHVLLRRTKWGYRVRVIGRGPRAARYAGMNVRRQTVLVLLCSGLLAGLAGMGEVAGIHFALKPGVSSGYGYDGIIVACLAGFRPLAVPIFALVLGVFIVGGEQLQSAMNLPASISLILEGALLFGLLASEALLRYRLVFGAADDEESDDPDEGGGAFAMSASAQGDGSPRVVPSARAASADLQGGRDGSTGAVSAASHPGIRSDGDIADEARGDAKEEGA